MRNPQILPALLYPTDAEVKSLARAEASVEHYKEFTPLARGFVMNAAHLSLFVVLAALTTPFRLVWRACRQSANRAKR